MLKRVFLFICAAVAVITSCDNTIPEPDPIPGEATRTVFIYIAADNNLNGFVNNNLKAMVKGAEGNNLNNGNLLIYVDPANDTPCLYQITKTDSVVTLQPIVEYTEEQNSVQKETLQNAIAYVLENYPAKSYGLGLWSHGTAWLPGDAANKVTRSFGDDHKEVMEINDLRDAIPDHTFDFIFFDACYMASAEVIYALKDKAKEIMASSTEIMADSYPYNKLLKYFFTDEPQLDLACQAFYDHYNALTGADHTATISLTSTDGLAQLTPVIKEILANHPDYLDALPDVQPSDYLYSERVLYDLKDFIDKIATPDEATKFDAAFRQTVLYSKNTETCYFIKVGIRNTKNIHGLSVFVMGQYPQLDAWYKQLDWYKAIYE